ncbi:signal peptidase I [Thiofilum flexile]|uniref:signal peptidase I n=1 Tax=Thiofilum flexile TaxID=125627 RepID=UPI00036A0071|nr:signal peptidase I [Thiofilum flexile]
MRSLLDLELILVTLTVVSGLIWLGYWLKTRNQPAGKVDPVIVDYAKSFFPVLFVVLVLRSFIMEPFRIPSGSMLPTLEIGDFILVNKFAYGVRLPLLHNKIIETGEPKVGDVAVFRFPQDPSIDFIKRVIGVPGDRITINDKVLSVNGIPVERVSKGDYIPIAGGDQGDDQALRLSETLNGKLHDILIDPNVSSPIQDIMVPPGHYFMMGDNRDHSNDSRYWGFVPEENLVGKAVFIWLHWNIGSTWPSLSRAGGIE